MANAQVGGDAVADEDSIVAELEETCAEIFQKEILLQADFWEPICLLKIIIGKLSVFTPLKAGIRD